MALGDKIKLLRLKKGVTQEMAAQEFHVSSQAVSKWENNICTPDIALLPKISIYFGVTIDELFDLTTEQRLHRIEQMLDIKEELPDSEFNETIEFLEQELEKQPDNARIHSFLAHTWHHRMASDSRKVSRHVRECLCLKPDTEDVQWLLEKAEGAAVHDWNCNNHYRTIRFYQDLIADHPEVPYNYPYLMENLLADNRAEEAGQVLELYRALPGHKEYLIYKYEARIALVKHFPDLAQEKMDEMERQFPGHPNVLFEKAGFYAATCQYEKAITCYEKSWDADERPRYYDALQGEALIYEIQGNYEQALRCWDRIRENLEQEWGVTEGAPLQMVQKEKERILNSV